MNGRHRSQILTILTALMIVGCTQRSYVMSFTESEKKSTWNPMDFGTHATLEDRKQTPDRVTAPMQNATVASTRQNRAQQSQTKPRPTTPSPTLSPAIEIQDSNAEPTEEIVSYDHSFSGNETEHIKFSAYDPFGGTGTVFGVNLDTEAMNFTYPIAGKFSSGYGRRGRGMHSGVDLVAPLKTPIYAAFDGTVRLAKPYSGYGNVIVLRHSNGLETVYAHNSRNLVAVGQSVTNGQQIAECGRTGRASTEHLHFEVRIKGQTINPALLLDIPNKQLQKGVLVITRAPSGSISAKLTSGDGVEVASTEPQSTPQQQSTPQKSQQADVVPPQKDLPSTASSPIAPAHSSKGIRIGDTIYDAPATTADPAKSTKTTTNAKYHTIVSGDTLGRIAQKYKTTVSALCALNNITKTTVLRLGKKLQVK